AALPDKVVAADALAKFDAAVDDAVKEALQTESTDYASVKADLDKTGFLLFPQENGRWGTGWFDPLWGRHGLGIVVSILLLSLGAPFWFNVLKSLASLRSSVAGNIADENKAAQKNDGDQKPGAPPPTVAAPPQAWGA
ncbi:MAG TPA: hypothetical protein VG710_14255, partial [Opitutus sp.]|nr:hypothetical protein [Opitutus sp.]